MENYNEFVFAGSFSFASQSWVTFHYRKATKILVVGWGCVLFVCHNFGVIVITKFLI